MRIIGQIDDRYILEAQKEDVVKLIEVCEKRKANPICGQEINIDNIKSTYSIKGFAE